MTACTNNGGKARRVVTAALVGVLSVGAVPAIALATGADVELQAVTEIATMSVVAKDGDNNSVEAGATFVPGDYPVVTGLTDGTSERNLAEGESVWYTLPVSIDAGATATEPGSTTFVGLGWGGEYYERVYNSETEKYDYIKVIDLSNWAAAGTVTVSQHVAELYFNGELTSVDGKNTVLPGTGNYSVFVRDNQGASSKSFSFKVAEPGLEGLYVYDADATKSDTSFTFDAQPLTVAIADSKGNTLATAGESGSNGYTLYVRGKDGVIVNKGTANANKPVEAGEYTAELVKDGVSVKNIKFTVNALDLSTASVYVDRDFTSGPSTGDVATRNEDFLDHLYINGALLNDDLKSCLAVSVDGPGNVMYFGDAKGVYDVELESSRLNDTSILNSASVSFANVDVNAFTDGAVIMYGDENITNTAAVVNLIDGETFDPSKLSVRYNGKTYSGDSIELINCNASDTSKEGVHRFIVRLRAFEAVGKGWVGGTKGLSVVVNGADLDANQRLYFYLDGKLAGNGATVTYDGGNWLDKLEVVVKDADGNEIDPSNYEVKVTDESGKEVESVTDAGDYEVKVTGKTFDFDLGGNDTFYLTVAPLSVEKIELVGDITANNTPYLTWTGEVLTPSYRFYDEVDDELVEVEVPAEAYDVTYTMTYDETEDKYVNKKDVVVKDAGTYIATFETAVNVKNYVVNDAVTVRVTKMGVFLDVPMNEWYSQGVYDAAKLGYMNGDGAGKTFSPMRELTRAEAACVLFNMAGGDALYGNLPGYNEYTGTYETGFSDVTGNEFYAKAVAWAEQTGVINGYADGTFGVSRKVTNEEFACMLANYAKAKGEDVTVEDADATLAAYPDASVVSDWAKDSVAWAVEAGVMGNGSAISPAGSILRMRAATMVVNYQPEKATDQVLVPIKPNRQ